MITLSDATAQVTAWLAASTAVASNQSYEINGRKLTRVDAEEIRMQLQYWTRVEASLTRLANNQARVSVSLANLS